MGAHRSYRHARFSEPADVLPMGFSISRRDEAIERLPQRVLRTPPEHPLRSGVEQRNPLLFVNRDECVGRGLNDAVQALLGVAELRQLLFGRSKLAFEFEAPQTLRLVARFGVGIS